MAKEIVAADPPHDWVPPSSAAGAGQLTGAAAAAFGCGSLAVAHRPNEWIPAGDLGTAIDLTEALVRAYTTA
jgi:acetylornithine deacetylase/succinyl-diaminopimelate desuccinylase-like protein